MDGEEARADDALDVAAVKLEVEIEHARRILALPRLGRELAVQRAQSRRERLALGRGELGGHAGGEPLEVAHYVVDLLAIVARERRHDQPPLAPAPGRRDEAFLLEAVEGAADGRAAQAQPLADDALGDPRAGGELPPDDDAAQVVVGARDVVLALIGAAGIQSGATFSGGLGGRA